MVSVTCDVMLSKSMKVDPLCTAEVDSTELADVRSDCFWLYIFEPIKTALCVMQEHQLIPAIEE